MSEQPTPCPPLLAGLVDDAGLFPPTQLPMADALARHRSDERAAHPMLTHRFVVPASRIGELRALLVDGDEIRLGLILDGPPDSWVGALDAVAADDRVAVAAVDVPLSAERSPGEAAKDALARLADLAPASPAYLEPSDRSGWAAAITVIAEWSGGARRGVKIRCGGATAGMFPSPVELGAAFDGCAAAGVAMKASAGLHHAVRHRSEATGFEHHGYLNLLVAAARASAGTAGGAEAALASTDGAALVAEARSLSDDDARRARRLLASYGSCSTAEPVREAGALGLLSPELS